MKNICELNGIAVVLPKVISVSMPYKQNNSHCFSVAIVGDEDGIMLYNNTLEESLSRRNRLLKAIEIMYLDRSSLNETK